MADNNGFMPFIDDVDPFSNNSEYKQEELEIITLKKKQSIYLIGCYVQKSIAPFLCPSSELKFD